MALNKARSFEYRPPKRRQDQLEREGRTDRPRIQLPHAGNGRTGGGGVIRLIVMLAAIIGLAMALMSLR